MARSCHHIPLSICSADFFGSVPREYCRTPSALEKRFLLLGGCHFLSCNHRIIISCCWQGLLWLIGLNKFFICLCFSSIGTSYIQEISFCGGFNLDINHCLYLQTFCFFKVLMKSIFLPKFCCSLCTCIYCQKNSRNHSIHYCLSIAFYGGWTESCLSILLQRFFTVTSW